MKVIVYAQTLRDAQECAEKWFPRKQGGTYLITETDGIHEARGLSVEEIHMTEGQYRFRWLGIQAASRIRPALAAAKDPKIVLHL